VLLTMHTTCGQKDGSGVCGLCGCRCVSYRYVYPGRVTKSQNLSYVFIEDTAREDPVQPTIHEERAEFCVTGTGRLGVGACCAVCKHYAVLCISEDPSFILLPWT
jgi:hypothetical protein